MDYLFRYWEKSTDFDEIKRQIGNKKVAVWGAYINGKHVRKILQEKGLEVSFYIDGHKDACEYDGLPIRRPDKEIGRDIYVFVAVVGVREEIVRYLDSWNYERKDYTYISRMLRQVTITECAGGYADCNGNRLDCEDDKIQCRIEFNGFNSKVKIGKDFVAREGTKIVVENGCEVVIGNFVCLDEDVTIEASAEGKIVIGNNCLCGKDSRIVGRGGETVIGDYCSIHERFYCSNTEPGVIKMGNDCMVSCDVSIIPNGHSIFNIETSENIVNKRQQCTKIGNHVWLGKNAVVLHNSEIGDGCIVGASSVVRLHAGENSVIAGNPAKIIKVNYAWDRRANVTFEDI